MNRFDNTSKLDREDDNDARGNCTKQNKILGKLKIEWCLSIIEVVIFTKQHGSDVSSITSILSLHYVLTSLFSYLRNPLQVSDTITITLNTVCILL